MTAATDRRPQRRADVERLPARGGAALLDRRSGRLHVLNGSALAIWELCDGETETAEMVEAVSELVGLPVPAAAADVERALMELDLAGLLDWRSP